MKILKNSVIVYALEMDGSLLLYQPRGCKYLKPLASTRIMCRKHTKNEPINLAMPQKRGSQVNQRKCHRILCMNTAK